MTDKFDELRQRLENISSERIDLGNVEQLTKDVWLFLTNDSMPEVAEIKREAFEHEVSAMIESARQFHAHERLTSITDAYDEYVQLLNDEIVELLGHVDTYRWKSSRHEKGVLLREKIESLKF
jgi:hypothetical protein